MQGRVDEVDGQRAGSGQTEPELDAIFDLLQPNPGQHSAATDQFDGGNRVETLRVEATFLQTRDPHGHFVA